MEARDPLEPTQRYNVTFQDEVPEPEPEQANSDQENGAGQSRKRRKQLPWVVLGSFSGDDAFAQAKESLADFGNLQQAQQYGTSVKVTDFKCPAYWLHDCPFRARIKFNTTTAQATSWTLYEHDHTVDNRQRGLKRAAKEFLEPYLGLACAKPKTLYNQLINESGIPKEDLPTLEVGFAASYVCKLASS